MGSGLFLPMPAEPVWDLARSCSASWLFALHLCLALLHLGQCSHFGFTMAGVGCTLASKGQKASSPVAEPTPIQLAWYLTPSPPSCLSSLCPEIPLITSQVHRDLPCGVWQQKISPTLERAGSLSTTQPWTCSLNVAQMAQGAAPSMAGAGRLPDRFASTASDMVQGHAHHQLLPHLHMLPLTSYPCHHPFSADPHGSPQPRKLRH